MPKAKFPCGACKRACKEKTNLIFCEGCFLWHHIECEELSEALFTELRLMPLGYRCNRCIKSTFQPESFDYRLSLTRLRDALEESVDMLRTAIRREEIFLRKTKLILAPPGFSTEGTKRQKQKLFESRGYTYNVKRRRKDATDWQCTVRPKENRCPATVIQRGETFTLGSNAHNHTTQPGADVVAKVLSAVKSQAAENLYKPASAIVNEVLREELGDAPCPSLPKTDRLSRAENCFRQKNRPTDPLDLDFILDEEYIPGNFLRGDVKIWMY